MISYHVGRFQQYLRFSCLFFILAWLADHPLQAVEANGNFNNNSDPGSGVPNWTTGWNGGFDGWNYVGQVNGASGTYLGNGWVITAAHVGAGNWTLNGTTYPMIPGSSTSLSGGNFDLVLFQISSPPALPQLFIRQTPLVPFSASNTGDPVVMIGFGGSHGETWGADTVTAANQGEGLASWFTIDFLATFGTTTIGSQSVT
ncbi:MAG TPA: hypothetical protein VGC39_06365, partial [Candidatus Methylacidiphilales bacterium]